MGSGDTAAGRAWFERARESAVHAGDAWLTAFASHFLAIALTYEGEYDDAAAHFEQGNELIERVGGHRQGVAFSLFHLARIATIGGDLPVAAARLRQAIECFRQVGDRRGIGYSLAGFAILAAAAGEAERAARIAGAVAALQLVLGPFLEAPLQAEYDEHVAAVRATLDPATYAAAWAAGQAMGIEQAIADASSSSTP